jgi:hypothetical protein
MNPCEKLGMDYPNDRGKRPFSLPSRVDPGAHLLIEVKKDGLPGVCRANFPVDVENIIRRGEDWQTFNTSFIRVFNYHPI